MNTRKKLYTRIINIASFVMVFGLLTSSLGFWKNNANKLVKAETRPIVVDSSSVALFDQIPPEYLEIARETPMMFSDRSVGVNINEGLNCLTASSWGSSPASCRRDYYNRESWQWKTFTNQDLANGNVPEEIIFNPSPITYNRNNWVFEVRTGSWSELTQDFITNLAPSHINSKDVLSYQFSYLNVQNNDDIANLTTGFFANNNNKFDVHNLENYISQHPDKTFIFWTTSLARGIGNPVSTSFNDQMRAYTIENNKILFDVADILSHDPQGNPCFDNRDGVQYCTGNNNCENYPDDGFDYPAICQDYTTETDGGHLGSVSVGKIRVAKAFWVLMAQIAGWNPEGTVVPTPIPSTSPTSTPAVTPTVEPTPTMSPTQTPSATPTPTVAPTVFPTATPTLAPTATPLPSPSVSVTPPTSVNPDYYWSLNNNNAEPTIGVCAGCQNLGAIWTQNGFNQGAFEFVNGGRLDFNSTPIGTSGSFSIEAWIRPNFNQNSTTSFHSVYGKAGVTSVTYIPSLNGFRATLRTTNGNNFRADARNVSWNIGDWNHILVSYDGSNLRFWWNGELKDSIPATGSIVSNNGKLFLGSSEVGTNSFNGTIDEFKIYSSAVVPNL